MIVLSETTTCCEGRSMFWIVKPNFLLARRCIRRSLRLDRARELRDDEILVLATPTEDEMAGSCSWSVVTGVEQTVIEDNPCVVVTVSNCASGEAGFDGIVVEGGEKKITTDAFGCPKIDGVNVGKSNLMSIETGNESSLSVAWESKY